MDAFDADVLIYAAAPGHELGRRVLRLLGAYPVDPAQAPVGVGSTLLIPELLTKPTRAGAGDEIATLVAILSRLDLRPVDQAVAQLGVALGAAYGLSAADAVHLATAVAAGADRFITNNSRDFSTSITEIDITYPVDLPAEDDGR